jgi:hypothetical protein
MQAPIAETLCPRILSKKTHAIPAAAVPVVVPKACTAIPLRQVLNPH